MRTITLVALMSLAACSSARLEIRNQSSSRLEDMTIETTGDTVVVGAIEPLATTISAICPSGEAGSLLISFRAGEQLFRSEQSLYFECDSFYKIRVDVSPSFATSIVHDVK